MDPLHCSVFGAGAWGTAMAIHLQRMGHAVTLVPRRLEQAVALVRDRENKERLPGRALPSSIQIGYEAAPALLNADVVFFACPSQGLRQVAGRLAGILKNRRGDVPLCITLCKGLEADSFFTPSAVLAQVCPQVPHAALSGPSHADDVAAGLPTALVLAHLKDAQSAKIFGALAPRISDRHLRLYLSDDLIGVELSGVLKNIYAIGVGLCDGMKLGDNAKAAYLTRCLCEMVRAGNALGGKPETMYGLSGFGDLVATCNGLWSRNRCFGEALATGRSPKEILSAQKSVVEGYFATECFYRLCKKNAIDAPILEGIYAVLFEGASPLERLNALMQRSLKSECRP